MKTRTIDFTTLKTAAMAFGVASIIAVGALSQAFAANPNHTHGDMTHAQMSAQCSQHMTDMKGTDQNSTHENTNHHRS